VFVGVGRGQTHSIATSLADYAPGTKVQKYGATSGHTQGIILTNEYYCREANQELVPGNTWMYSTVMVAAISFNLIKLTTYFPVFFFA
jgi:predicted cupin superfamily sugar epimerase